MSNYKIILNEERLKAFIDWLPELEPHEKFYFCLFSRSKYCKETTHISSDKAQLKRGVSDKQRLFDKIKQLEIPLGNYKQRDKVIPQEALALYITVNPRSMPKATANLLVKLATSMRDGNIEMNCHAEAMSQIQKARSRTVYIDFDIDEADKKELDRITTYIGAYVNIDAITWIHTRGGMHCLIDPSKVEDKYKKTFYQNISKLSQVDQTGDQMVPVPGCFQGGFEPELILPWKSE